MISFLILLSFLLHLVLFIIIFQLYQHIQKIKEQNNRHLEILLSEFMDDIRLENKRLEDKINLSEENARMNSQTIDLHQTIPTNEPTNAYEQWTTQQLLNDKKKQDAVETSIESKILRLASEGKSITEIAKSMNRGKTEIELLLKLNKIEEIKSK